MTDAVPPPPPPPPAATGAPAAASLRRGGCGRRLGLGCLALVVVLALAAAVLWATKPWAPKIEVVDAAPGGTRVHAGGVLGNWYPARGRGPAVLVLGGSEGGLSEATDGTARALNEAGYSALAVSYWGGPGQPQAMDALPLETFDTALTWLSTQPQVDPRRLGVMGASKGGEAALLVASRHPELAAVVGYVPSSVAWQGLDLARPWRMATIGSTWSAGGAQVPYLSFGSFRGGDRAEIYRQGLQNLPAHPEAVIPIERTRAPVLLICGEADTMWPGCAMSRAVQARAQERGGPPVDVLAYPDAGHFVSGPPVPAGQELPSMLGQYGGTPANVQAARADSWPKVLDHLRRSFAR